MDNIIQHESQPRQVINEHNVDMQGSHSMQLRDLDDSDTSRDERRCYDSDMTHERSHIVNINTTRPPKMLVIDMHSVIIYYNTVYRAIGRKRWMMISDSGQVSL